MNQATAPAETQTTEPEASLPLSLLIEKYPNLRNLVEVQCPVIAILAQKQISLGEVLGLDVGSVIVFSKHNSDPISLCVNNVEVGSGKTIKVGDHFGLHLRDYSQASVVKAVL